MNLNTMLQAVIAFGVIVAGAGYVFSQFKKGRNQQSQDDLVNQNQTFDLMRKQVDALQLLAEDNEKKIDDLSRQVGLLQIEIEKRDKIITDYLNILQNRNPELEEFMKNMSRIGNEWERYMQESTKTLSQVRLDIAKITPVPTL